MRNTTARGLLLGCAALTVALSGTNAHARPSSSSNTATSTLKTITVNVTARDETSCSEFFSGVQNWQCTPVLIATGTPVQPVSTGGSINLYGYATCEYRKRADGFTNDWSAWTSCGPYSKSTSASRTWGVGGAPQGALVQFNWPTIQNAETSFVTDCVEIRTSVSSSATAYSVAESVYAYTRLPSSGTNLSGICEGGSAY